MNDAHLRAQVAELAALRNRSVSFRLATVVDPNPLTIAPGDSGEVLAVGLDSLTGIVANDVVAVLELGPGYPPLVLGKTTTDVS